LLQSAIGKTRYLSGEMSPPVLRHADLAAGLRWLAARKKERFQLVVTIDMVGEPQISNLAMKQFIFRSAQELLYNIVKHAQTRSAHISLAESADTLSLVVSDEGLGFDPAMLSDSTAGFGLMTIQERTKYMGGKFEIESTPGKGSRFTLELPTAAKDSSITYGRRASDRILVPATTSWEASEYQKRVLVVDDHRLMRRGLINLLASQPGITVIGGAANGQEALDQTRLLHPDVVLMDISMPVMSGIEATKLMKKEFPAVRVIGLSMHQDPYISEHMHSVGAETTLTKTAGATELIRAIRGSEKQK
ncbi:MAG: response regulator, partial [bacterium]|nr:response regulator [bacterium]